jgi:O-antigen/teichoic acid export membrane protein
LLVQARGGARFKQLVGLTLALFALGAVLFWVLLGLFHGSLVSWIYGGRYGEYSYLLWLVGFLPLCFGILSVLGAALRALERPERVLVAYVLSTVTTLTVGLTLLLVWGIVGAVVGFLVSSAVSVGALVWLLFVSEPTQGKSIENIDHLAHKRDES